MHHLLTPVPKEVNLEEVNNFFQVNEAEEDLYEDVEVAVLLIFFVKLN
jgi:hypothetical protein